MTATSDCSACITNYALISSVCCKNDKFVKYIRKNIKNKKCILLKTDGLNSAACSATILCKVTSNFACTSNQCACDLPYVWVSGSSDCSACTTNYALISSVCCKYIS